MRRGRCRSCLAGACVRLPNGHRLGFQLLVRLMSALKGSHLIALAVTVGAAVIAGAMVLPWFVKADVRVSPYAEWGPARGATPRFTLAAEVLEKMPTLVYVETAKTTDSRCDWRTWSRVDEPTADFQAGICTASTGAFPKVPAVQRMLTLADLRRVAVRLDGPAERVATQFGDIEFQGFRAFGQAGMNKDCYAFYGTWASGTRSVSGWYCEKPNKNAKRSTVVCLVNRIEAADSTVTTPKVRPSC